MVRLGELSPLGFGEKSLTFCLFSCFVFVYLVLVLVLVLFLPLLACFLKKCPIRGSLGEENSNS